MAMGQNRMCKELSKLYIDYATTNEEILNSFFRWKSLTMHCSFWNPNKFDVES